jgi:protein phosphatase 1L
MQIACSPFALASTLAVFVCAALTLAAEPITAAPPAIQYGVAELRGHRESMEDRHRILKSLGKRERPNSKQYFFAVYDGHGGHASSSFCKLKLHHNLVKQRDFPVDMRAAMHSALLETDQELLTLFPTKTQHDGSTATFAVLDVHTKQLIVANSGDSRAVMSRLGQAVPLSYDHKPDRADERQRIESLGGIVQQLYWHGQLVGPHRVYSSAGHGGLAISRGVGDGYLKQYHLVIADPEFVELTIAPGDEFMVLATDGVWDVFSNQDAVDYVGSLMALGHRDPTILANKLVRQAIRLGSEDNVTAIVVLFDQSAMFSAVAASP